MVSQKSPDGGWGWVIVLVSFFTQFLCYGSPLAVGVLYLEWLDIFGEGKGKTAWIGSLASGVGLLASKSLKEKSCFKFPAYFNTFVVLTSVWFLTSGLSELNTFLKQKRSCAYFRINEPIQKYQCLFNCQETGNMELQYKKLQ